MGCPICRCPVVRNPTPFSNEGIAHQGCVDQQEAMRANEVRKRRDPRASRERPAWTLQDPRSQSALARCDGQPDAPTDASEKGERRRAGQRSLWLSWLGLRPLPPEPI